jgi:hypothetical protein
MGGPCVRSAHSLITQAEVSCTDELVIPIRRRIWAEDTWRETGSRSCTTKRARACAQI